MGYVPDATIAALRGNCNLGIFFRLGTVPALHLSFSTSDIPIYIPGLDDPATIYTGAGRFLNMPELETLINGLAAKVTFSLNGVDPAATALMFDTAPEVLGALVTVGIAPMDERWQPTTQIIGIWTGTADFVAEEMKVERDQRKNRVQSIMLTTTAGDTTRALPNLLTYTNQTQQMMYPTDNFFSRVTRYIQGYQVSWPRF